MAFLIKLSIQVSCLFMCLSVRYVVVVCMLCMLLLLYFACDTSSLTLKELLSLFVRLNFHSSQSGKKLNYCLLQFAVSQQNSVGRNSCLFTTPPSLCYFKPPTK